MALFGKLRKSAEESKSIPDKAKEQAAQINNNARIIDNIATPDD